MGEGNQNKVDIVLEMKETRRIMQKGLFFQNFLGDYLDGRKRSIRNKIAVLESGDFNVAEDSLVNQIVEEYTLVPPNLYKDRKELDSTPSEVVGLKNNLSGFGPRMVNQVYIKAVLRIPFDGDYELLSFHGTSAQINDSTLFKEVIRVGQDLLFTYELEPDQYTNLEALFERDFAHFEFNVRVIKTEVESFNNSLLDFITPILTKRKGQISQVAEAIKSVNIPIRRRDDSSTYSMPEIRRKPIIIKRETNSELNDRKHTDPTLDLVEYEYILKVIKNMSLSMERSPLTFKKLKEPEIRDFFIIALNGHYEGNATGETFNGIGKTDILIRYQGENAFIGECLMWKGTKYLAEKIDQLNGYITWRDTKTAIIIFYKGGELNSILDKINTQMTSHSNYESVYKLSSPELQKEGVFSYKFKHPTDVDKNMFLTVMAFQVDTVDSEIAVE